MIAERIGQGLAVILAIGAGLHGYGSFLAYSRSDPALAWSVGSAFFALFLAALCIYAEASGAGRGLSLLILAGLLAWFVTVLAFGALIGNVADPRVLYHLAVTAALMARFALRSAAA